MFRGKKTYIQAYPILLHFALLCFIDVAFFYKWKARPYIHCNTHCIAVIGNEPTVSLKSASREVKVFTSSGCCKMDIGSQHDGRYMVSTWLTIVLTIMVAVVCRFCQLVLSRETDQMRYQFSTRRYIYISVSIDRCLDIQRVRERGIGPHDYGG